MMTRPVMLLASGWAHPADCLASLAAQLRPCLDVALLDPDPDALRARLEALPVPAWLAGWSLGGMLALQAAAAHPSRARGLILISSTARFTRAAPDDPAGVPAARLRALTAAVRKHPAEALGPFLGQCAAPAAPLVTAQVALTLGAPALLAGLERLAQLDLRAECAGLQAPALILHGAQDRVIPPAAADRLARDIPGAQGRRHPTAGHDLPLREPEWVGREILSFIGHPA